MLSPDGCTDIVWRRGEGAVIAGPDTGPWHSITVPEELILGARFLPGAGGPALGVPLSELRDRRVAISTLGLDSLEELHGGADPHVVPRLLASAVARLVDASPPDRTVQAAVARLRDPTQRVEAHLAPRVPPADGPQPQPTSLTRCAVAYPAYCGGIPIGSVRCLAGLIWLP